MIVTVQTLAQTWNISRALPCICNSKLHKIDCTSGREDQEKKEGGMRKIKGYTRAGTSKCNAIGLICGLSVTEIILLAGERPPIEEFDESDASHMSF